jgi:hypothetical protein
VWHGTKQKFPLTKQLIVKNAMWKKPGRRPRRALGSQAIAGSRNRHGKGQRHYRKQVEEYRQQTGAKRALLVLMTAGKVIET